MALVDLGLRGANEAGPRAGWVAAVQAAASATTAAQAQAAAAATMATKAVVTVAVGLVTVAVGHMAAHIQVPTRAGGNVVHHRTCAASIRRNTRRTLRRIFGCCLCM